MGSVKNYTNPIKVKPFIFTIINFFKTFKIDFMYIYHKSIYIYAFRLTVDRNIIETKHITPLFSLFTKTSICNQGLKQYVYHFFLVNIKVFIYSRLSRPGQNEYTFKKWFPQRPY